MDSETLARFRSLNSESLLLPDGIFGGLMELFIADPLNYREI